MAETIFEANLDVAMQIAHNVAPPTKIVKVSVSQSPGYVLAEDILALTDLPPFSASRVDGYAVNGVGPWKISGTNLAGQNLELTLGLNEAVYVATGAPIPKQTTSVLKQEDCAVQGNLVTLNHGQVEVNSNIRPLGVEAKAKEIVVPAGAKVTAPIAGLIAAAGFDDVSVYEKPIVDVLIFGDELVHTGQAGNGKVRDSISPQLASWISHFGGQLGQISFVEDQLASHVQAIKDSTADLIITTGGTASGPVDHLHEAIEICDGALLVDAVLVRPGYHQLIAQLPNKFLIGLPGNPQSAVIGLNILVANFIAGATTQKIRELKTKILNSDVSAPKNEHRFVLARELSSTQLSGVVEPVEYLDSSMLRGFVEADGFAVIEPGGNDANSQVFWIPLPS